MKMTFTQGGCYDVKETHTWGKNYWNTSLWSLTSCKNEKVEHHISEDKIHKSKHWDFGLRCGEDVSFGKIYDELSS